MRWHNFPESWRKDWRERLPPAAALQPFPGILASWNSPVILIIRSLAPALAVGCTVVGKLPGLTAETNAKMNSLFAETASLPKGVLNVLTEAGSKAAPRIVEHPDVPTIA